MLSLPVSRPKLLLIKFSPRIFLLILVFISYSFLSNVFSLQSILKVPDFAVFFFTFFLVSASFSISLRSFIGTFFLTTILSSGLTFFDNIFTRGTVSSETILRANMILLAFPILFFIFFFKFDMKPLFKFNLRFIGYSSLIIFVMIGARFLQIERSWCYHLMTNEGGIYRMSPRGIQFIDEGKIFKKGKCFWPLTEQGDRLYLQNHRASRRDNKDIFIFNKKKVEMKRFHKTEKAWWTVFSRPLDTAPVVSGNIYFLQKNRKERLFRISSFEGTEVKKYPLNTETINAQKIYLFHVSASPLRFYIRTNRGVALFNAEGNLEQEVEANAVSVWSNKLMTFSKGKITLYKVGKSVSTEFTREGGFRKVLRRFGSEVQRKVVYKNRRETFIFSFEDESTVTRKVSRNLIYYKVINNKFYLVYLTAEGIAADIYEGEKLIGHESWETGISGYRRIMVFEKGIVVSNGKEYEKYLFNN